MTPSRSPAHGLVVVALAGLLGCAVGPEFRRPETNVAQSWRGVADERLATRAAAESAWWKAFNDPALDRLVELAYRQNLPLQIAGLRIVESRARLGVATGREFPQLQVAVGSATAVGLSKNAINLSFLDHHYGDFQLGFDAAWELDFWGKFRRGVESEAANLLASVADYQAALVSTTAEVARTYVAIRTFEVLIAQARENARIQEDALGIAQARYKNGATSELDPTQATALLESTRTTIPQLESSLEQARNALDTLLGQPAGASAALSTSAGAPQIPKAPPTVAVGMPAEMLRRRPDIRSAELVAAAQCARIGVAKAELFPSFTLLGTFGLQATTRGGTSPKFFSEDSIFYAAGPRVSWPFFNYGRLTNGVRVEDARFQQLLVAYRDTVLHAVQEVEDALTGFIQAQAASTFAQNAVTASRRAVEIAMVQYREGATDYQRVIDAERSLLEQENTLAQSSSSVATNLIALYKALGGGWELRQGQPVVQEPTQHEMKERTNWGGLLSEPRSAETKNQNPPGAH